MRHLTVTFKTGFASSFYKKIEKSTIWLLTKNHDLIYNHDTCEKQEQQKLLHNRKKLFDIKREGKKNIKIKACKCDNPSKVSEGAAMHIVESRTCACGEQAKIPVAEMPPIPN